jgi:hypothetical protein
MVDLGEAASRFVWDQIYDEESDVAFAYFRDYLHMPKPRSIQALAREKGVKYGSIGRYSASFKWLDRARAYDEHFSRMLDEQLIARSDLLVQAVKGGAVEDYARMRRAWEKGMGVVERQLEVATESEEPDASDLAKVMNALRALMASREQLDRLGRRVAQLPQTYRNEPDELPQAAPGQTPSKNDKQTQQNTLYMLTVDGPRLQAAVDDKT